MIDMKAVLDSMSVATKIKDSSAPRTKLKWNS